MMYGRDLDLLQMRTTLIILSIIPEIHGDGFKRLKEGQKVNFEPGEDDRKRSVALSVTVEEQE